VSEPLDLKRRPKLSIDGKYGIPFTTAVMTVKGNVTLRDYGEGLRGPASPGEGGPRQLSGRSERGIAARGQLDPYPAPPWKSG
jgi:hypothetical protein